jgi:hypothetical protein
MEFFLQVSPYAEIAKRPGGSGDSHGRDVASFIGDAPEE